MRISRKEFRAFFFLRCLYLGLAEAGEELAMRTRARSRAFHLRTGWTG